MADGADGGPDDVERVHAAAEHAAHDAQDDGDGDGLLLAAGPRAEDARGARIAERQQGQHDEDRGRVAPVHPEDDPAHQEQAGGLPGRHHEAGHGLGRHDRSAQDRGGGQPLHHADAA